MASTLILTPASSPDGAMYFAKNSNREPNECQLVVSLPAVKNDPITMVNCSRITIPQARQRFGILLSKPWWSWGGEMGMNDQGVVIGSEAIFTRDHESEPGLIGMDLVRLGLERGHSAEEAIDVITALLQKYGQGGTCARRSTSAGYDNSFIVADATEAWIVETAGRHWAANRLTDQAVLSPSLILATNIDRHSYALPQYARRKGWLGEQEQLDFRKIFHRRMLPLSGICHQSRATLLEGLTQLDRKHVLFDLMQLLRRRKMTHPRAWSRRDVTLQAGGLFRRVQTTGSMVVRLTSKRRDAFFTATSAPEFSIFKPVHFNQALEEDLQGEDLSQYHERSLWWRHEVFHRHMLLAAKFDATYLQEREDLEKNILVDVMSHKGRELIKIRGQLQQHLLLWEQGWRERVSSRKISPFILRPSTYYWHRLSRIDGLEL